MHFSLKLWSVHLVCPAFLLMLSGLDVNAVQAQSCGSTRSSAGEVSVRGLRVSAKARQHFAKARTAIEQGKNADFERESARALAESPEFADMYLLRASKDVRSREYIAAIASVAEARRIEPNVAWAGTILASAFNGMGWYEDAAAAIAASRGSNGNTWQAMYEMTRAQVGLQNVTESLQWSARTIAAAPATCAQPLLMRANALLLAQRWTEAADQMRAFLASGDAGDLRTTVEASIALLEKKLHAQEKNTLAMAACTGTQPERGQACLTGIVQ